MDYQGFKNKVLGNGYDVDGFYGFQCFDGYAQFCIENGVPYANCNVTGFVRDIWEQRGSNGMINNFDEVEIMQPGDVAVFKVHPWTPYSHIAIFDSDIDGSYGWFLGQNQGGNANLTHGGEFSLVKLPYDALYPTAFRLKGTVKASGASKKLSGVRLNKGDYFLDVSSYQPADLSGIIAQAGTDKTVIKVSEHTTYISEAKDTQASTSKPIGYYHFARFGGDVAQAQAEATFFISNLPAKKVNYLVCDYEDGASGDVVANTNAVLAFMDACKQAGYEPIYYSYKPYTLANIDYKRIISKYPNSLWIAAYPDYNVTPDPVWSIYPEMEGVRWWQFTSTGIAGGLDKNVVILPDNFTDEPTIEEDEDEMANYVVRSKSGKQGYVGVINGDVFGIGDITTVEQFIRTGAKELNLEDGDFDRFLESQRRGDNSAQVIANAIASANKDLTKIIAG